MQGGMKSPSFLILDTCYLGKNLAADPPRQSGQRSQMSSRKHDCLPTTSSKQRQNGSWRMVCHCRAEIALSIVAATSAARPSPEAYRLPIQGLPQMPSLPRRFNLSLSFSLKQRVTAALVFPGFL